ncbi:MAG: FAD-dependent oxidoreductase [Pseudomonadota bacterium]
MRASAIPVWKHYGVSPAPEIAAGRASHAPVLIVGGGPIGLSLALDLAKRGQAVTIINSQAFIAAGSKAICFSKRSLDIFERLGVAERMLEKGVVWETGKVFWREDDEPLYTFDLLPLKQQQHPAFINIQQYYVEQYLVEALRTYEHVDLRWGHSLEDLSQSDTQVSARIVTEDGTYDLTADYLIACDGSRSFIRKHLGLEFDGRAFEDNFLIADVRFKEERPAERWFHFDPPYPGWSSLVHKQPDGIWRLDFQLGWDIDKEKAVKPENVDPFVRGLLGDDIEFEYEWLSIYTFQCRRMDRFVHDRVVFAGDSAHLVSPFGARGCNGGLADIDNLSWKLERVLNGFADHSLLETYNAEAITVADENILNSSRSTDFLTPKTEVSTAFRDAVLSLARDYSFARPFVNSGRLSTAVAYKPSSLTLTHRDWRSGIVEGTPCLDAPVRSFSGDDWLLHLLPATFCVLAVTDDDKLCATLESQLPCALIQLASKGRALKHRLVDIDGLARERLCGVDETLLLFRPDQYLAGRWNIADASKLLAALPTLPLQWPSEAA